jgi:hypothetical protein
VWPKIHREIQRVLTNVDTAGWQRRRRRANGPASRKRGPEQRGAA